MELWRARELLYFLTWRDIRVRYKQTLLGATWAVLQPFLTMIVFSLFFGRLAKIPSDGVPYPVFSYAALVPWTFFANGMSYSANSLVSSAHLVTKLYFPRAIVPIAAVMSVAVDFLIAFGILVLMMVFYSTTPSLGVVLLPGFFLLAFLAAVGIGLLLSALNVHYRDVKYTVPFAVQLWLFLTPIAYPSSLVPEPWRALLGLNPMASVVEGFRWGLLGASAPSVGMVALSCLSVLVVLGVGGVFFRKVESRLADVI